MNGKEKKSYVGGLTGAGTIIVFIAIFNILLYPSWWQSVWFLNLSAVLIGVLLLITALIIQRKK
jgi:hypothetical protein